MSSGGASASNSNQRVQETDQVQFNLSGDSVNAREATQDSERILSRSSGTLRAECCQLFRLIDLFGVPALDVADAASSGLDLFAPLGR